MTTLFANTYLPHNSYLFFLLAKYNVYAKTLGKVSIFSVKGFCFNYCLCVRLQHFFVYAPALAQSKLPTLGMLVRFRLSHGLYEDFFFLSEKVKLCLNI